MNNVTCIGDLLHAAGYRQRYVGGASLRFAGKGRFYRDHGFEKVLGLDELQGELDDPEYVNNWGLYDDSMFAFAAREFAELSADGGGPFNLTLLTVDTHHPAGTPSRSCPEYPEVDNRILHSVHCTDFLLRRFLEDLRQNPAWNDTVVVITSDHLAMRNIATDLYPEDYSRELFTIVLNAGEPREIPYKASQMDMAPTILELLDVTHEHTFLAGDNLMAPGIAARDISFGDSRRISMIKTINADFFTRQASNICSKEPLLEIRDGRLYRAREPMYLGKGGRALPLTRLEQDHSSITFFEDDGTVNSTVTINTMNLPYMLYQGSDYNFLALTSARAARQLLPHEDIADGIVALGGNVHGDLVMLGGTDRQGTMLVDTDCGSLLPAIGAGQPDSTAAELSYLAGICPADGKDYVRLDAGRGRMHLEKIAVENSWYSAVLQQESEDTYRIAELNFLSFMKDEPGDDFCHAYFWRNDVLIPRMVTAGGVVTVEMKKVSGSDELYRITESLPQVY